MLLSVFAHQACPLLQTLCSVTAYNFELCQNTPNFEKKHTNQKACMLAMLFW